MKQNIYKLAYTKFFKEENRKFNDHYTSIKRYIYAPPTHTHTLHALRIFIQICTDLRNGQNYGKKRGNLHLCREIQSTTNSNNKKK